MRQGSSRNIAKEPGQVGIKNKLWFQSAAEGEELETLLNQCIDDPAIAKNKIRFVLITDFYSLSGLGYRK
ncbi:hypothetical protein DZJ_23520 [Dickeya ananatis]